MPEAPEVDAEDAKLVTLARSARARNNSPEGAAVRDDTGRSYVATSVDLPSLSLSALKAAVVIAVASGAAGIEAAAVVTASAMLAADDRAVLAEMAGQPLIFVADPSGAVHSVIRADR